MSSFSSVINIITLKKVDFTSMDVKKLVLYSYDKTTNTYKMLPTPNVWIDKNGYLHFTTIYARDN